MSERSGPSTQVAATDSGWQQLARGAASGLDSFGVEPGDFECARELLVFGLDGSAYAVDVELVREIVRMKPLTRVPRAPGWLLGVVSLRGEVVEVVDLRIRLGLGASTLGPSNRIMVLHGEGDGVTGLLVDSVTEVHRASAASLMPAPVGEARSVVEVCRRGDGFVSLLDVERVLGVSDV